MSPSPGGWAELALGFRASDRRVGALSRGRPGSGVAIRTLPRSPGAIRARPIAHVAPSREGRCGPGRLGQVCTWTPGKQRIARSEIDELPEAPETGGGAGHGRRPFGTITRPGGSGEFGLGGA